MLLSDDSTIEDLFYSAPAWSKTCLFFCQQFLNLGLESGEDNSEHDLAGMVDGRIALTLLEVAFFFLQRYDERLCFVLRPYLRLQDLLANRYQTCCCCLASILKQHRGNVVHS